MPLRFVLAILAPGVLLAFATARPPSSDKGPFAGKLNVKIPHISTDKTIKYDYDIVYVRAKRAGDKIHKRFYTDIATPVTLEPGADLMLLKPNGKEEVLVKGGDGAVTDPVVSFDGQWVYYTLIHTMKGAGAWQPPLQGADIYKLHVPTRKIVRLTHQEFTPNTGAADWSGDCRKAEKDKTHLSYGVLNFGAFPLPGGRIVFTSNRNAFRPPRGYPRVTLQLFVMDDDGSNVEQIGHLNLAGALHPMVLRDGRILFSSLENQGIRGDILWGIWSIHPDGSNWNPVVSAFDPGGAPNAFHFQTQLSKGEIVVEGYYNLNNSGFGTYIKLPETAPRNPFGGFGFSGYGFGASLGAGGFTGFPPGISPPGSGRPVTKPPAGTPGIIGYGGYSGNLGNLGSCGGIGSNRVPGFSPYGGLPFGSFGGPGIGGGQPTYPTFGPAYMSDPRNAPLRIGRHDNGKGKYYRMPFMPLGAVSLTPFARIDDGPADLSDLDDKNSPRVGKFTHPSGAPDNHLLTVYSPGPTNHQYTYLPQIDGGIYLLKDGKPITEPAQLRLIKNDPDYNEQWPRALVPYKRIYGIDEPKKLAQRPNDGKASPHLPEGTPFGLVGSSSLYKRESYPNGVVLPGKVTAEYAGGKDPWRGLDAFTSHGNGMPLNWHNQGAEAGLYTNDDIQAIRILAMEPTTDRNRGPRSGRLFRSHAGERLRILGEIPVRKFKNASQPRDPDNNPDTSFLAKIPADVPFTFQTLDRYGMVLNMAQTWHQVRPGEIRHDCGGCHAHSQLPTPFAGTAAAKKDYKVWDLTQRTPLLTDPKHDESKQRWDVARLVGLRFAKKVTSVEYHRDVKPILERSCVKCHSVKHARPAGNLALDGPDEAVEGGKVPGGYYRLAMDTRAKYGHKPVGYDSWGYPQASRYIRKFQSRRSLLIWKVYGKRLDGFRNEDHPSEPTPGAGFLTWKGKKVETNSYRHRADVDFDGSEMPPRKAVLGSAIGPDGNKVKVHPLTDEDRRTLTRWIDLGCPLDLDYDAAHPEKRGYGFACDDTRPTLTLTYPAAGANDGLDRFLVGMDDYYSGLDQESFRVVADFAVDGAPAGTNLAERFRSRSKGVWELRLKKRIVRLQKGTLTVSVKDQQGNISRIVRTFWVGMGR